jgi:hypothetical protein
MVAEEGRESAIRDPDPQTSAEKVIFIIILVLYTSDGTFKSLVRDVAEIVSHWFIYCYYASRERRVPTTPSTSLRTGNTAGLLLK